MLLPGPTGGPRRSARDSRVENDPTCLGQPAFELLDAQPGERILDLGCGDGALTARIAEISSAVGVDASPSMIDAARARGLDARIADAQRLDFIEEFDAVFTNAAMHWMPRIDDVVGGVARALRSGGRFVGETALLRFYVLHCVALPLAVALLIAVHFWRVRKDGGISGAL